MAQIPAWCEQYTRLQYADKGRGPVGFDCWGFVRLVEHLHFGVSDLPDLSWAYSSSEHHSDVSRAANAEISRNDNWEQVDSPQPGDIVILKIGGRPWHCGICIGGDWMMHMLKDINVGFERFTREPWRNRVEGFYRHV